jgi:aminoglycoside phosphotransferase (APT) family kinase protein
MSGSVTVPFSTLTSELACEVLAKAGLRFTPEQMHLESREEAWVIRLPENRLAWFAASAEGQKRLAVERRVLRLLQERCTFLAPSVISQDKDDDFDVRAMVPGVCDPARIYVQLRCSTELAEQTGAALGAILADQHAGVHASDVAGWLPLQPRWPKPAEWIRERLVRVTADPQLAASADAVLSRYEGLLIPEADRALVHTDLGLHNMAFDPATLKVCGLFDYECAAWADRHHDFRYLVFDYGRYELLDAAISVYEATLNRSIDRRRVFLYNAACALTYLADRAGTGPQDRPCGRTLAEDERWSKHAIATALDVAPGDL